jgi:hypothetical protein
VFLIFFSETTGPIETKFGRNVHWSLLGKTRFKVIGVFHHFFCYILTTKLNEGIGSYNELTGHGYISGHSNGPWWVSVALFTKNRKHSPNFFT